MNSEKGRLEEKPNKGGLLIQGGDYEYLFPETKPPRAGGLLRKTPSLEAAAADPQLPCGGG